MVYCQCHSVIPCFEYTLHKQTSIKSVPIHIYISSEHHASPGIYVTFLATWLQEKWWCSVSWHLLKPKQYINPRITNRSNIKIGVVNVMVQVLEIYTIMTELGHNVLNTNAFFFLGEKLISGLKAVYSNYLLFVF